MIHFYMSENEITQSKIKDGISDVYKYKKISFIRSKTKKHKKPIGAKEKISERYEEPFLNTK